MLRVYWQEGEKPLPGEVNAGLQGAMCRDKFGPSPASNTEAQLSHTLRFTIVCIEADYECGMRSITSHTARGWK